MARFILPACEAAVTHVSGTFRYLCLGSVINILLILQIRLAPKH
jgi:hypothetical protein